MAQSIAFVAPSTAVQVDGRSWAPAADTQSQAPKPSDIGKVSSTSAAWGSLGATAVALGSVAAVASRPARRQERVAGRTARRFLGGAAPAPSQPKGPLAVPMLPEPEYRSYGDTFLAEADAGFDPFNFASTASPFGDGKAAYWNYREAELKHGRLAMLATLGWVAAGTLEPGLARRFGMPDLLAKGELAPSVLNGGLLSLPPLFLPGILAVTAWIELAPQRKDARENQLTYKPQLGRMPGDYGFDPLDLATQSRAAFGKDKVWLHNAELKHGRAGMIAITIFAAQEFLFKIPVLTEDEKTVDAAVQGVDQGIEALDKATGLTIPDIPVPFPGA